MRCLTASRLPFGDFRAGYTVAERPDLRILRDPFSAKPHVLILCNQACGRRCERFCCDQVAEIRGGVSHVDAGAGVT